MKKVSTITGIIIIVAVAVIAVGGIFLYLQKFSVHIATQSVAGGQTPVTNAQSNPNVQNSNTKTADWKTYKNDEYGFEIKYPYDWSMQVESVVKNKTPNFLFETSIRKGLRYVTISVITNNFTLGSRPWEKFELGQLKGSIACPGWYCEILTTDKPFYIETKYNPIEDSITKQILSTFKFTK